MAASVAQTPPPVSDARAAPTASAETRASSRKVARGRTARAAPAAPVRQPNAATAASASRPTSPFHPRHHTATCGLAPLVKKMLYL